MGWAPDPDDWKIEPTPDTPELADWPEEFAGPEYYMYLRVFNDELAKMMYRKKLDRES